jgi:N-methylhydantoinase A
MARLRVGVEVGGTFTDWVVSDGERVLRVGKVISTPGEPDVGVMNALAEAGVAWPDLSTVVHGSTIATNVVLERKGARTALVTTEGFRDVLAIQRQAKQRLFDLFYKHPTPLVSRDRILEADEKLAPDGSVRKPLRLDGLLDRLARLVEDEHIESLAVCLLHSYANPAHEGALQQAVAERFPGLYVSISSDVLPQFREYERTSTVVMSAYTRPVVDRYVGRLERRLSDEGFRGHLNIIQANGGSVPASAIRRHAVKMILSGPAAGVIGATATAMGLGIGSIITFDMGGTSTDVCLVNNGEPKITTDYKIGGLPLALPMLDIVTVGAGGGSIASVDRGGMMRVGPESAGADPGPASYGRGGTTFTVTDANVALGYIRASEFSGGKIRLAPGAIREPLDALGRGLGFNPLEVAESVRRLVNFNMAQAMRLVSIERGYDPRDYTIVAYGGGGPLHAAQLAEELGCRRVLIPVAPGTVSALGLLIADTKQDFVVTRILPASGATIGLLRQVFGDIERSARKEFEGYGVSWGDAEVSYALDMRYLGQAYELTMPVDDFVRGSSGLDDLVPRFHRFHRARYGHASGREDVEVVNFRLAVIARSPIKQITSAAPPRDADPRVESGTLRLNGEEQACRFCRRETLPAGFVVTGPAVIEEATATTFIPPGWAARVERTGVMLMTPTDEVESPRATRGKKAIPRRRRSRGKTGHRKRET